MSAVVCPLSLGSPDLCVHWTAGQPPDCLVWLAPIIIVEVANGCHDVTERPEFWGQFIATTESDTLAAQSPWLSTIGSHSVGGEQIASNQHQTTLAHQNPINRAIFGFVFPVTSTTSSNTGIPLTNKLRIFKRLRLMFLLWYCCKCLYYPSFPDTVKRNLIISVIHYYLTRVSLPDTQLSRFRSLLSWLAVEQANRPVNYFCLSSYHTRHGLIALLLMHMSRARPGFSVVVKAFFLPKSTYRIGNTIGYG